VRALPEDGLSDRGAQVPRQGECEDTRGEMGGRLGASEKDLEPSAWVFIGATRHGSARVSLGPLSGGRGGGRNGGGDGDAGGGVGGGGGGKASGSAATGRGGGGGGGGGAVGAARSRRGTGKGDYSPLVSPSRRSRHYPAYGALPPALPLPEVIGDSRSPVWAPDASGAEPPRPGRRRKRTHGPRRDGDTDRETREPRPPPPRCTSPIDAPDPRR
jgi:hypothetical protein